jgi:acyl-CoA thioester hydrolase
MDTFHRAGISMVCLTADCAYKKTLVPEEKIAVHASVTELTRARLAFGYRVYKLNGQLAAEGSTTHAYLDNDGNPFNLRKRHPPLWERLTANWAAFKDEETRLSHKGR